ncbi:MAG TPA: S41 family peptidase [Pyrinomonadaceae bacterium]|jgi:C-terminal processing protease CtpA/Prc
MNFTKRTHAYWRSRLPVLLICWLALGGAARAQKIDDFDRQRGQMMLEQVKNDIKSNYYDPTFHGLDLDAAFKAAGEKIKSAQSNGQIMGIIAQTMLSLNDSHTFFLPPQRQAITDYGFEVGVIGDDVYVTKVKAKSDAEQKGLKVGDRLLLVDAYQPARENLWKLVYLYFALRPQPGMHLTVLSSTGQQREFDVLAKVTDRKRMDLTSYVDYLALVQQSERDDRERKNSHRTTELGDLFIWKMPEFNLAAKEVDALMDKAAGHKAFLIDLRGNPGGYEETLLRVIGNLFDHDVRVGETQERKSVKPLVAKTRGAQAFKGQLLLLVDGGSASSAEMLARVVQLEKRGTVIGDRTSGAVMRARQYSHEVGITTAAFFGASVTNSDVRMSDGKSLEHTGVTPDEIKLPTGADLAAKSDPVLAYAASKAGVTLDPAKAGALFPELKKN